MATIISAPNNFAVDNPEFWSLNYEQTLILIRTAEFIIPTKHLGDHNWLKQPKDQLAVASCAAFAVGACYWYHYEKHVSESLLFVAVKLETARNYADLATLNSGLFLEDVCRYASTHGVYKADNLFSHKLDVYARDNENRLPSDNWVARKCRDFVGNLNYLVIFRFDTIIDTTHCKVSLLEQALRDHPAPIAVAVRTSRDTAHAIVFFGFGMEADGERIFFFKNSWGRSNQHLGYMRATFVETMVLEAFQIY